MKEGRGCGGCPGAQMTDKREGWLDLLSSVPLACLAPASRRFALLSSVRPAFARLQVGSVPFTRDSE